MDGPRVTRRAWLLAAAMALGASCGGSGARPELLVYAATSTRDALQALAPTFEAAHGVRVVFNFGSSGDLARQLLAAPVGDVFLSADEAELGRVEAAGLVAPGARRRLLTNTLVIVEPGGVEAVDGDPSAADPTRPDLLLAATKRLSLGDPGTVPVGRYARAWLEQRGLWEALQPRVVPAVDARAALAAVESGAADKGVVFRTDAARSRRARIVFEIEDGPAIVYPVAPIAGRGAAALASAFVDFLGSAEAREVFEGHGFGVLTEGEPR